MFTAAPRRLTHAPPRAPRAACLGRPHLPLFAVAAAGTLLVAAGGLVAAVADADWSPAGRHWLAAAHPFVGAKGWALKTAMVLAAEALTGHK